MSIKAPIYYDDLFEAIDIQIMASGLSKKELAAHVWPGRRIETAKSLFSRAINPENTDVHLSAEHLIAIMDLIGPDHIINYLCDRYFYQRPSKRDRQAAALNREQQAEELVNQLQELTWRMKILVERKL
jgi:hypothetical protein